MTTRAQPKRRTLLPWMGGKSKLAAQIIDRLPPHTAYVEPFCGGCAVFFRKPRSKAEILNDADNRLVNLLRVFRYHPDELLKELRFMLHSRQDFADAITQPGLTDIQRASRFLLLLKTAFGSKIQSPHFGYSKTSKAAFSLSDATALIAEARARLDGVVIENLDFAEVIHRYDSPQTLFYCDPPYIDTEGYAAKFGHDDHRRLREALGNIKGMAMVSINDHALARELYDGWDIEEVTTTYSLGNVDHAAIVKELLVTK